jgi:hypothetical protein
MKKYQEAFLRVVKKNQNKQKRPHGACINCWSNERHTVCNPDGTCPTYQPRKKQ